MHTPYALQDVTSVVKVLEGAVTTSEVEGEFILLILMFHLSPANLFTFQLPKKIFGRLHRQSRRYLYHAPWTTPCDAGSPRLCPSSTEFYVSSLLLSLPCLVQLFSFYSTPQAGPAGLRKQAAQDVGTVSNIKIL